MSQFELKNLHRLSFEWRFLQRIRFWIKFFTTCQKMNWNFKIVSKFGEKLLSKNHHVTHCTPENGKNLHFCGCFKSMILIIKKYTAKHSIGNISTSHIFNTKFYKASVFKSTFQTRVRCWIEHFTTCQVFSRLLLQFAIFSCVHQTRARFDTALKCGVSSVSQDILLG